MSNEWEYYNHAIIPTCAPHEEIKIRSLETETYWKQRRVYFARWTSDFDCGYKTEFWYCIKVSPSKLKFLSPAQKRQIKISDFKYCL